MDSLTHERERRWRLILGKAGEGDGEGEGQQGQGEAQAGEGGPAGEGQGEGEPLLSEEDQALDEALDALYGEGDLGGDGDSSPDIARWLGDIRTYFPGPVAQLMQGDALKKFNLRKLLKDPEILREIEPDIGLVTKLLTLNKLMPTETRETARQVVKKVVDELKEGLEYPLLQALAGSLNRSLRVRNPRKQKEISWLHTIKANLKHYQPDLGTVIPETLVGYGKERSSLHDVILCIDQSGSMAQSVVYASIFGSVMASVPALATKLILFDTNVVDMTDELDDPVDLLFGLRLRGGTNIDRALRYCEGLVERPRDTVLVLISDLFEGAGDKEALVRRAARLKEDGVKVVVLLALSDQGAPRFNRAVAQNLADAGIPSFACTPELFPDLMGAVLSDQDIRQWAAGQGIVPAPNN